MSNDLIHEVEESLKQERMEALWKEYGSYVIAACVLAVLFTAVITGWRSYNARANAHDTELVLTALDQDNKPEAIAEIVGQDLRGGHEAVARLTAAGLLMQDGEAEKALEHYRATAADGDVPKMFRELATYLAVRTEWGLDKEDADPAAYISELRPVISNDSSSWRWHSRVLAAMIYAEDMNDYSAAREVLKPVTEERNLPFSLIQTARALDQVYQQKLGSVAEPEAAATRTEEPEG